MAILIRNGDSFHDTTGRDDIDSIRSALSGININALYSWSLRKSSRSYYITKDLNTNESESYWLLVISSTHTSYGSSTASQIDFLKLNYTPWNGVSYRGLVKYALGGNLENEYSWDTGGIKITYPQTQLATNRTFVIAPINWQPE